ncbi:hypothetical protein PI124_g5051 [Phytophthora idaei]|nr:hypothetical protein PI125_g4654 [Phytophthora idaei]KAG3148532.1 hypothetical protein PI126_g12397 [Phytophthora idaei]KAG3250317.1 hypothetical protein PI124_g5051 [Phytophthora idaei]
MPNIKDKIVQWVGCCITLNMGSPGATASPDMLTYHELPDENKETDDNAVRPSGLMPDAVSGEPAACYLKLLQQYQRLYDGHLGRMRFDECVLPLSPDFKPVHAKLYAIPRSMEAVVKGEIQGLIKQGALKDIYDSEMASPAITIIKPYLSG